MCSNTSHSSGGDINDGYGCDSIYSKKTKRARMPKRGPGVAELEKILREQETKIDHLSDVNIITTTTIDHGFSLDPSSISLSNSYLSSSPHSPPPPPPILKSSSNSTNFPKNASFPPDPNPFTTRMPIFASNSNSSTNNPALGGNCGQISGSAAGLGWPHHTHLPTMWDHYQQQQQQKKQQEEAIVDVGAHRLYHPSPNFQKFMQKNQYSPPSMINLFPHSAMPSSTIPQAPSAGRSRCKEPPSSQNSRHHSHYLWADEDKTTSVVGTKRSRPVAMEMPPIPQFRYHVPTFSTSTPLDSSSFSSSYGSRNNVINLEPTDSMSREMKMGSVLNLEPNLRKCSTDYCPDSNFLLFGPSAIPSPPTTHNLSQRERPFFCSNFPFQESMEETQFRPAAAAEGVSIHKKPFYSFLLPMELMSKVDDASFSLNNGRTETRGDGIDLSLRL